MESIRIFGRLLLLSISLLSIDTFVISGAQEWKWNGREWVMDNHNYFNSESTNNNGGNSQRNRGGRERRCWQGGRWVPEGTEEDRGGRFFYKCVNGRSEPSGCITPDKRRIREFETFTSADGKYELTCQKDQTGTILEAKLTGCIKNGRRIRPGESYDDRQQYFLCKQVNAWHVEMEVAGCITANRQRVTLSQESQDRETWFRCERNVNGNAELHARGCVRNGQKLRVGDQYPEGDFVYYCKVENGRAETMCVGCQSPTGQELFDGDRYTKVRYEEDGSRFWEMKCVEEGSKAVKEAVGCIFKENGIERLSVPPGTFTLWWSENSESNVGVGCRDNARGQKPTLFTFDPAQLRSSAADLTFKSPQGRKRRRR